MKNFLLIIALALFGFRAAAQDYRPFVEEGKVWQMEQVRFDEQDRGFYEGGFYYCMQGDTIVNGKTWKKVYKTPFSKYQEFPSDLGEHFLLVREENQKVYFQPYKGAKREEILYDFSVKQGDTLSLREVTTFGWIGDQEYEEKCNKWDSIVVRQVGLSYKTIYPYIEYTLERKFVSNSGDSACVKDYWADGVGSLIDPFVRDISRPRIGPGSYVFVHGCKVKGREVYLAMTMGLKIPQINTDKAAIYDLSGRRLQAIPQRGVYIVNGKKYIR